MIPCYGNINSKHILVLKLTPMYPISLHMLSQFFFFSEKSDLEIG